MNTLISATSDICRLKCDVSFIRRFQKKVWLSKSSWRNNQNLISLFVVFASITLISLAFVASISAHCWTSTPYHVAAKVSNQFFSQFYVNTLSTFLTFFVGARSSGSKDSRSFSGMQSTLTIVARDEYKPASTLTLLKRSQAAQEMEDDLDEQDDAPDSSNFDDWSTASFYRECQGRTAIWMKWIPIVNLSILLDSSIAKRPVED